MVSRAQFRPLTAAGVGVAATAGVAAVMLDSELEVTMVMAAAVATALVCFDTAIARRVDSGWSWVLLSAAPIAKTVPLVIVRLRPEGAVPAARYELGGSLVGGMLVLAAIVLLARPAHRLGRWIRIHDAMVILGCGVLAAAAGASVAFLADPDLGTVGFGRLLETPTWFVIGALLAGTAQAAGRSRTLPAALAMVLVTSAVVAAVLAYSVVGGAVDAGVWALVFALFAAGGALAAPGFGGPMDRTRASGVSAVASLVAGGVAAAAAVSARSDPAAWGPGWIVLGAGSLAMFAAALVSRPVAAQVADGDANVSDAAPVGQLDRIQQERAVRARERALRSLSDSALSDAALSDAAQSGPEPSGSAPNASTPPTRAPRAERTGSTRAQIRTRHGPPTSINGPTGAPGEPQPAHRSAATSTDASASPSADSPAPSGLATAHHTDPSTGLLSAAGLQHRLRSAFAQPVRPGHVSLMMLVVRNLEEMESRHGRLASAAVTREVASRIVTLFPDAAGARFGRAAYAVLFTADLSDSAVRQLATALLRLRAPVDGGTFGDRIDVVAGMAQCYEGESVNRFIDRANTGLARAMSSSEATLVAMP